MDVGGMSPGTQLNRLMDNLGFPDKLGDLYGMSLDKAIGNDLGVARNMLDLFSPLKTSQLDKMMSGGFAAPGSCPRPHDNFGHHWGVSKHTHYDHEKINVYKEPNLMGMFGKKDVMIDGKKIDVGNDWGVTPKQLEAKMLTDPAFRQKIESQLGGRIVLDGNADGNITIAKKVPHPMMPFHNHVHQHIGNMIGRAVPNMLNGVLNQMNGFLKGVGQGIGQAIGGATGGSQQPGGAQGTQGTQGTQGPGAQGGADELDAILKNPNMSFEAKLAAFMMKFAEKKQKEIEGKMEQMKNQQESGQAGQAGGAGGAAGAGGASGAGGTGAAGGKGGGFLGGIVGGGGGGGLLGGILGGGGGLLGGMLGGGGGGGMLGGILGGGGGGGMLGGLLQMGGGLVGGMFGGPLGASMGSAIGGAVGGAAGGAQGAGGAQAAGGAQGAAGAGQAGAEGAGKGKSSEQIAMKELETMMQAFQRMWEAMGNSLKSMHEMALKSAQGISR